MLGRSGQWFVNGCYRSGVAARALQRLSGQAWLLPDAARQSAPCTSAAGAAGDLRFRSDVDWWAGGASDGYETWNDLARRTQTQASRAPSGRPSEKVVASGGRSSRMLVNPFQGLREPAACLNVMMDHRFDAGTMSRAVGVHTLQKALHAGRYGAPSPDDLATVSRWLSPLLEPEPAVAGKPRCLGATAPLPVSAHRSLPAVGQLRERGAVLLLYSLAKLRQARGWTPLLEDETVRNILQLLLQRMEQLTSALDAQAVSNSLYALALLKCRNGGLIAGLTVAVDAKAPHMTAQQLSNVLWALARLDVALPDTLLTASRELATRQSNAQDIANAVWALGHLDCTPSQHIQEPLGKLVVRMLRPLPAVGDERISRGHVSSFLPRHHVNVVWGLSRLGLHSRALYDACAGLLIPQMKGVGDQGLAMLASVFGGGFAHARQSSRLAMPLLCAVGDSAHARVLQGRIIPDALAQCVWYLWLAAAAPTGAVGCLQVQGDPEERKLCRKRLLGASARGEPIRPSRQISLDGVDGDAHEAAAAQSLLAMQPAEGDVATQHVSAVAVPRRALRDCVNTLVQALSTIRPQVADRFLHSMQPLQRLQILVVGMKCAKGTKRKVLLQRLAAPLLSGVAELKPSEVVALCNVMSRAARAGLPMDAELATAVALHMWSGKSGVTEKQRDVLLGMLGKHYSLPIHVNRIEHSTN